MAISVDPFMQLVHKKFVGQQDEYNKPLTYIRGILSEIQEVSDEIKPDNVIFLEDELGDIFWDYCNLLICLEKEGKIRSREDVFIRAERKYEQRISSANWNETKKQQKLALKAEHDALYH